MTVLYYLLPQRRFIVSCLKEETQRTLIKSELSVSWNTTCMHVPTTATMSYFCQWGAINGALQRKWNKSVVPSKVSMQSHSALSCRFPVHNKTSAGEFSDLLFCLVKVNFTKWRQGLQILTKLFLSLSLSLSLSHTHTHTHIYIHTHTVGASSFCLCLFSIVLWKMVSPLSQTMRAAFLDFLPSSSAFFFFPWLISTYAWNQQTRPNDLWMWKYKNGLIDIFAGISTTHWVVSGPVRFVCNKNSINASEELSILCPFWVGD